MNIGNELLKIQYYILTYVYIHTHMLLMAYHPKQSGQKKFNIKLYKSNRFVPQNIAQNVYISLFQYLTH